MPLFIIMLLDCYSVTARSMQKSSGLAVALWKGLQMMPNRSWDKWEIFTHLHH